MIIQVSFGKLNDFGPKNFEFNRQLYEKALNSREKNISKIEFRSILHHHATMRAIETYIFSESPG